MISSQKLQEVLLKSKMVDKKKLKELVDEASAEKKSLIDYVIEKKLVSEDSLFEQIADYLQIPYVNLEKKLIRKDLLLLLPETSAQNHKTVIFDVDNKKGEIFIATLNPEDIEFFESIKKKTSLNPVIHITTQASVDKVLKQYHKKLKAALKDIDESKSENDEDLQKLSSELPIVRIIDTILEQAFYEGASDIHIEPEEKQTLIRYRVDGILSNVMTLPKKAHSSLIARIKVLANLKVDEHRLPQDGRFKVVNSKTKISFRVSIIPASYGEKIVMRLLNETAKVLSLEELGLQPQSMESVKRNIKKPHGMILVTGPTGSGKTTTLYTIINILNTPDVNISTIEDPIEYHIEHVNQSQVNPKIGYTFASGLRAFLRQDPDIIMVGEIRDNETAEIAVHAALTGHLVLSTLHTNDALTTLPRLLEMGVAPFLVSSTTNIIIAQRLVRKICPDCIYSYYLKKEEIEHIKKQVDLDLILNTLKKEKVISEKDKSFEKLLFYKGKGCQQCGNSGYRGRLGIYETLDITPELSRLIAKGASENDLRGQVASEGVMIMVEDGFIKAKNGKTTIDEVLRVTKE
ncbi:MAG: type II/IV secretion system protein [bacterium]|nr:type II/IV secretion system protein [bacterium]